MIRLCLIVSPNRWISLLCTGRLRGNRTGWVFADDGPQSLAGTQVSLSKNSHRLLRWKKWKTANNERCPHKARTWKSGDESRLPSYERPVLNSRTSLWHCVLWHIVTFLKILGLKTVVSWQWRVQSSATYWAFWSRGISSFCGASASSLEKRICVLKNWMLHRHQVVFSRFTHGWSNFFWEDFHFRAVSIVGLHLTTSGFGCGVAEASALARSGGITWRSLRCPEGWRKKMSTVSFLHNGSSWMSKLMVTHLIGQMLLFQMIDQSITVFCVVPVSTVPVGTTESQLSTHTLLPLHCHIKDTLHEGCDRKVLNMLNMQCRLPFDLKPCLGGQFRMIWALPLLIKNCKRWLMMPQSQNLAAPWKFESRSS